MSQYYLMAQLPSLDGLPDDAPLPVTEERFHELCERFLGRKTKEELNGLSLVPDRRESGTGAGLTESWNRGERQLRWALAIMRAEKMGKPLAADPMSVPQPVLQAARTAVEMEDPLAAERYLLRYRLAFLENLRPADAFSEDAVVYYGLKLKLLARVRRFDGEAGENAYRTIYDSIMHREEREKKQ